MKKMLMGVVVVMAMFVLVACGGKQAAYVKQVEALDQTNLTELNYWLSENEEDLDELFNMRHRYVDVAGEELDYETQVVGRDSDRFVKWSVEATEDRQDAKDRDRLTFTYMWDIANSPEMIKEMLEEAGFSNITRYVSLSSDVETKWMRLGDDLYISAAVSVDNGFIISSILYSDEHTDLGRVYQHEGLNEIHIGASVGWESFLEEFGVTEKEMVAFFEWYAQQWYEENNE